MKTFFTLLLMLSLSFVAFAQKKTFQVETILFFFKLNPIIFITTH